MGYITLNKHHFFHNLELICKQAGDIDRVGIVLKDNAYGHGLLEIATLSHEFGIKHAIVRTLSEASIIEHLFQTVLVLADIPKSRSKEHLHITVNDLSTLELLPQQTSIELKCDTGMHRNGLKYTELEDAFKRIASKDLTLKGVFTHHKSADELSSDFFWQEKAFETFKEEILRLCSHHQLKAPRFHSANSAALFRSTAQHDLVRVGIAAYGLLDMPSVFNPPKLQAVLSLWGQRIHTQTLLEGVRVGYGGTKTVSQELVCSTYDIGYGDGLLRLEDGSTYATPNDATLLGRVSMDNTLFDSDDEHLCIFDNATEYAKVAHTISYEVIVRLSNTLERKVIN